MAAMANQNDQVIINFGPARYDSPKAIRNQIEAAQQETQESTVAQITNDPNIDIGGGTTSFLGDVTSYIPTSRTGSADSDGANYNFTNGTGTSLDIGDEVILNEIDGIYYVVGVTDRVGNIVPVPLPPAAALSPDFPIDGTNLPFPIQHGDETGVLGGTPLGYDFAYDIVGGLGLGVDGIIGYDGSSENVVNLFVRSNSYNASLFTPGAVGSRLALYCQSSGTLIQSSFPGSPVYYRTLGAASWTTATATYGIDANAFDHYSDYFWILSTINTTPLQSIFYRLSPSDTSPVQITAMDIQGVYNVTTVSRSSNFATFTTSVNHTFQVGQKFTANITGAVGFNVSGAVILSIGANTIICTNSGVDVVTTVVTGTVTLDTMTVGSTRALFAENGYLILRSINAVASNADYYLKAAGDDTTFTFMTNVSLSSFNAQVSGNDVRIDANGNPTYIYQNAISSTFHLRKLNMTTGVVDDYDLGIPNTYSRTFAGPVTYTRVSIQAHKHTQSGLVLLQGIATDTELGLATNGFYPALAAYNYVSSTYVYWDEDMPDQMATSTTIEGTTPVEISSGVVRIAYRSATNLNPAIGSITRHYELSGL